MLFALRAPLPTVEGKELPKRLLVAKWGRNEAPSKGITFFVNETTMRELPRNQKALGFDAPALDFEHNTLPGTPAYEADKEPRNIAATGAFSVVAGEGLYYSPTRWTPEGEKSVLGGHHPDLSGALKFNDKSEVIFGHSVALCRHGSVPEMQVFPLSATLSDQIAALSADPSTTHFPPMNYKELLCAIIGLSASATDAEISTASKNHAATLAGVTGFSTELKSAKDGLAAMQKRLDDSERANITALAVRDGKIIPLSAKELPLEAFKTLVGELERDRVPLDKRTPEGVQAFTASGVQVKNGADEEVRIGLGLSKAQWDKA
jgi:phage I-like protein